MFPRGIWPRWLTPVNLDVLRRSYVFVQQMISISIDLNSLKHDIWIPRVHLFPATCFGLIKYVNQLLFSITAMERPMSQHTFPSIYLCSVPAGGRMEQSKHFVLITNLTHFFNVLISLLYMFRATQCSSSGESIVSIHHLVCITLCRWLSGMQVRDLMYWYNWFSWWWALGCSKHVEKWN